MIVHVDMDAFFASVEQMDNPALRGRPVMVGGGERGVVATASYEARRFGVHSAMPAVQARRLCPEGIFVRPRFERYKELSGRIMEVLQAHSPLVEQASIDEAYLDAEGLERLYGSLAGLVCSLRCAIRSATGGLTCSVGAAPVKFLAKICSDVNKPDGVFILEPGDVDAFLASLPVRKIPGVGPRMAEALGKFGIRVASDMRRYSPDFFRTRFGRPGLVLLERAMGRDERSVEPVREAKSESAEETLARDTRDLELLRRILLAHAEKVGRRLRGRKLQGRTVTLKIKYADFTQITRSKTLEAPVASTQGIYGAARELLEAVSLKKAVRLIGVGVSNFGAPRERLTLLSLLNGGRSPELENEKRRMKLDRTLDALRERFGEAAVARGALALQSRDGLEQGQRRRHGKDPEPSAQMPDAGNLRG